MIKAKYHFVIVLISTKTLLSCGSGWIEPPPDGWILLQDAGSEANQEADLAESYHQDQLAGDPSEMPTDSDIPNDNPSSDPMEQWVADTLDSMSTKDRIGQLLLVGESVGCQTIQDLKIGGLVYYPGDVTTVAALRSDTLAKQRCAQSGGLKVPLLTSTNHEGGRVHYFEDTLATHFASAKKQCDQSTSYVQKVSQAQAEELTYCGIHVTLSPVADVLLVDSNVIGDRAYSTTPTPTANCTEAAIKGYHQGKIQTVIKHFPGHGGTSTDSHWNLAKDDSSLTDLQSKHLVPFWRALRLAQPPAYVMTSHVIFPSIDASWPTSLSKTIIDLVKNSDHIDFHGAVMTDDLYMQGITDFCDDVSTAAMLALIAGNDLLLIQMDSDTKNTHSKLTSAWSNGWQQTVNDVNKNPKSFNFSSQAIQNRINDAVRRILRMKYVGGLKDFSVIQRVENTPEPDWSAHKSLASQVPLVKTLEKRQSLPGCALQSAPNN